MHHLRRGCVADLRTQSILTYLDDKPTAYLDELAWYVYDAYDVNIDASTVWRILQRHGWTRKACERIAAQRSPELRAAFAERQQRYMRADKVVCVDETASSERTGWRKYGWSIKNTPCSVRGSLKRSERWSVLPAITVNGYLPGTLIHQGSINAQLFEEWLEFTVLPQLEEGSIIGMDNASIHRTQRVRDIVAAANCWLEYLPPYSPDFNPIELSFGWLKLWVKRHFHEYSLYRTFEEFLEQGIAEVQGPVARTWFKHCGYVME